MEDDNKTIVRKCGEVTCELRYRDGIALDFSFPHGSRLRLLPIDMGGFGEGTGIVKHGRHHQRADGFSFGLETRVVVPFGIEPEIGRNLEFSGNHAVVTVDVQLKGGLPLKSLSIDPVEIVGVLRRVGIVALPGDDGVIGAPVWHEVTDAAEESFYCSDKPFLVCLAETADGKCWEVGTGDDLWRWQSAERYQADAEFRVTRSGERLSIEREVYRKREESLTMVRCLRFQWYVAWGEAVTENVVPAGNTLVLGEFPENPGTALFAWTGNVYPDSAWVKPRSETVSAGIPCALAHAVIKRFKSWIRSAAGRYRDVELAVVEVEPHFCCSAAHLERNRKPYLAHWDMIGLLELWRWGNRQLMHSGDGLTFTSPGDSPLHCLPSLQGLRKVPPALE